MKQLCMAVLVMIFMQACSTKVVTRSNLPSVLDENRTVQITVFPLDNFTDTPQAGYRAANLVSGVLRAKGYQIISHTKIAKNADRLSIAKKDGSDYLLFGGVSEWRYKTGIDGEPAVSMQLNLVNVAKNKNVWSSTASGNDWGNASIGTTAQKMIMEMVR